MLRPTRPTRQLDFVRPGNLFLYVAFLSFFACNDASCGVGRFSSVGDRVFRRSPMEFLSPACDGEGRVRREQRFRPRPPLLAMGALPFPTGWRGTTEREI